jgi:hypothetical protein
MSRCEGIEGPGEFLSMDAAPDPFGEEKEARALSAETRAALEALGYAHLKQPHSLETFERIAQQLGSIVMRTDLAITPDRSSIVYKSDAIAFHQDNPAMNILGWYCVRQDDVDGSALLLDTGDVADCFSSEEMAVMRSVSVRYPHPDPQYHNPDRGLVAYLLWPLLTEKATRHQVYYVPWLLLDSYTEKQSRVVAKFTQYLRAKEENQAISIRLQEGESLFIDNNRMLHGRGPIQPDSKRFLKRVWIKRDSAPEGARSEGEE